MHIVEYIPRYHQREVEVERDTLEEALRFADAVIEDGGSACVYTTEVADTSKHLCDVFLLTS